MADERRRRNLAAEIGARIRAIRENRGWRQKVLADDAGIHPSQLSRYEGGLELPYIDTLVRICDTLEVGVEEVAKGFGPEGLPPIRDRELRLAVQILEGLPEPYRLSAIKMLDYIIAGATQDKAAGITRPK